MCVLFADELNNLKDENKVPKSVDKGDIYVRWGKKTCPSEVAETVYSGIIGSGHYTDKGSPNKYVCLPNDPQWGSKDLAASDVGHMYGTEYETNYVSQYTNLHDKEAPCAICKTLKGNALMIPARTTCYSGWTTQYTGYLMSAFVNHDGSRDPICVDETMEESSNSDGGNQNGALLYFVIGKCGALKCPPYVDGKVLTCVVCSK